LWGIITFSSNKLKLLKAQYQDILQTLEDQKIPMENLSLVKVKGRIRVQVSGVDSHFEFFKRKSVVITETHQWQHVEHHELNISGKHKIVSVWSDVVLEFKLWLIEATSAS
jgi:hypothetical protein